MIKTWLTLGSEREIPETAVGRLRYPDAAVASGRRPGKCMILTGERVDAASVLRIGLVEEIVEKDSAVANALKMAERVVSLSPQGVEYSKRLIHQARNGIPRGAALAVERERFVDLFDHPNQHEGVNAFLGKRSPNWILSEPSEERE
jgi:enoyl-CoA hydratase/carnithine racemase